jgi:hypothetical protein
MAFPSVSSIISTLIDTATTSHSINISAGSGELALVFFSCNDDTIDIGIDSGVGSNWFIGPSYQQDTNKTVNIAYKLATGTSEDNLTLTTDFSVKSCAISYAIKDCGNLAFQYVYHSSSGTNMNPPSLTPELSNADYLWLVMGTAYGSVIATAAPTDFSNLRTIEGSSDGVSMSCAERQLTRGKLAYDPDAFTSASSTWMAYTVVIPPPESTGISINLIAYYDE